jgi:hypothetical protein
LGLRSCSCGGPQPRRNPAVNESAVHTMTCVGQQLGGAEPAAVDLVVLRDSGKV